MGRKKEYLSREIDGNSFFAIPDTLIRHANFVRLSPYAVKLVVDLSRQYTGFNNGYLCCSWSVMKQWGWRSSHTLQKAMLECEHYRIIERTQQGGLNRPNLHAFTWRRINEIARRNLDRHPTLKPSDAWKHVSPDFVMPSPKPRRARKAERVIAEIGLGSNAQVA